MRILTVRQPWAWAIIHATKNVENRVRNIAGSYRGPVAIHAGRSYDHGWQSDPLASAMNNDPGVWDEPQPWHANGGHIIGVVELTAVHAVDEVGCMAAIDVCSPWADMAYGVHHLRMLDPRPLAEPIPYRGALGLRRLDDATTARIQEAIA